MTTENFNLNENSAFVGARVSRRRDQGPPRRESRDQGLLDLRSTGRIEGKVSCGHLEIERGAVIAGAFTVGAPPAEPASAALTPERPDGDEKPTAHAQSGTNGAANVAA